MSRVWSALSGHPCRLLDLADIWASFDVRSRHAAGTRPVPIREIRGSEGRSEDFDADFRPLRPHNTHRWVEVAVGIGFFGLLAAAVTGYFKQFPELLDNRRLTTEEV